MFFQKLNYVHLVVWQHFWQMVIETVGPKFSTAGCSWSPDRWWQGVGGRGGDYTNPGGDRSLLGISWKITMFWIVWRLSRLDFFKKYTFLFNWHIASIYTYEVQCDFSIHVYVWSAQTYHFFLSGTFKSSLLAILKYSITFVIRSYPTVLQNTRSYPPFNCFCCCGVYLWILPRLQSGMGKLVNTY
jgi:hypothetical protein